jgi:hypothetical protein
VIRISINLFHKKLENSIAVTNILFNLYLDVYTISLFLIIWLIYQTDLIITHWVCFIFRMWTKHCSCKLLFLFIRCQYRHVNMTYHLAGWWIGLQITSVRYEISWIGKGWFCLDIDCCEPIRIKLNVNSIKFTDRLDDVMVSIDAQLWC